MGYIDPWLDVKGVGLVLNVHLDRKMSNDMAKELRKCVFIDGSVKEDLHNAEWPVYQAFPLIPF